MQAFFAGMGVLAIYYIICASTAFICRRFLRIPDEVFRKILHGILLGSLLVWTVQFEQWYLAALSALAFAVAVYPLLKAAERWKGYSHFVTERSKGELKQSLIVVFVMYAAVVMVCWGLLDEKLLALCSIYAWGFGDAAAALIGKRYGRHTLQGKHIEGRKSVEGTLAMFVTSFVCVLAILILRGGMTWYGYLITAFVTGLVSAAVELFTMRGMDTITCPLAAMSVLLPLVHFLGGGL